MSKISELFNIAGGADTNLSNLTTTGTSKLIQYSHPDLSTKTSTAYTASTVYQASEDMFLYVVCSSGSWLSIDNDTDSGMATNLKQTLMPPVSSFGEIVTMFIKNGTYFRIRVSGSIASQFKFLPIGA